jgi:hypothetical protein
MTSFKYESLNLEGEEVGKLGGAANSVQKYGNELRTCTNLADILGL